MKKLLMPLLLAAVALATITSCKKVVTALFPGIDVKVPEVTITVPPILIVPQDEMSLGQQTTEFDLDKIVRENTGGVFNASDIGSVKMKSITITVLNSDNLNNLSNFEYARLVLSSNSNVHSAEVARIEFPQSNTSTITVNTPGSPDLRSYLSGNQLQYSVLGKLRKPITKPIDVRVAVTVRVD